mgnify:CR=1 FL=1
MVLLLRKRDVESKTYADYEEFIWKAPSEPKIAELKKAVLDFKGLDIDLDMIELAKYMVHEFSWLHIHKDFMKQEKKVTRKQQGKKSRLILLFIKLLGAKVVSAQVTNEENLKKPPYILKDGGMSKAYED